MNGRGKLQWRPIRYQYPKCVGSGQAPDGPEVIRPGFQSPARHLTAGLKGQIDNQKERAWVAVETDCTPVEARLSSLEGQGGLGT